MMISEHSGHRHRRSDLTDQKQIKRDRIIEFIFLITVFGAEMSLAAVQMFGHPPDEFARFEVVYYIFKNAKLPTGYEIEVQIGGYGGSYAFQPILTYIIQGYLMRFVHLFTENIYILVLSARMVNCVFGVIMAYYVRRISCLLWKDRSLSWLFTCLIAFLPENIFIHSYINTDSMAAMGIAVIIYAMLKGENDDYEKKTMITLAVGVSLVALSYYNAYPAILIALFAFILHFRRNKSYKTMWKKMGFIVLLVFLMCGWWFIRTGIIYDGDFLGLSARSKATLEQASAEFNPLTKKTYYNTGRSIMDLLKSGYLTKVYHSFICTMGAMDLYTNVNFYRIDKILLAIGIIFCLLPIKDHVIFGSDHKSRSAEFGHKDDKEVMTGESAHRYAADPIRRTITVLFAFDVMMTVLMHLMYSYAFDYQPQGRYLLPMLISAMYFITLGADKLGNFAAARFSGDSKTKVQKITVLVRYLLIAYILFSLIYALYFCVLPYYRSTMQEMKYISNVTFMQYLPQPMKY